MELVVVGAVEAVGRRRRWRVGAGFPQLHSPEGGGAKNAYRHGVGDRLRLGFKDRRRAWVPTSLLPAKARTVARARARIDKTELRGELPKGRQHE